MVRILWNSFDQGWGLLRPAVRSPGVTGVETRWASDFSRATGRVTLDCVLWANNYAAFVHRLSPKINEAQFRLLF